MSNPVSVFVEYCGAWGYEPRFRELKSIILNQVPNARVEGKVGRRSSFEVTVNGKQIFSKLGQNGFPVFEQIAEECVKASKGVETSQVTELQKSSCVIS